VLALELPEAKADDNSKGTAQVNDGALVSCTSTLNPQQTDDVQNSVLLAQLAANVKYDRTTDTENWYNFFQNVLSNVGWVIQKMDFKVYKAQTEEFSCPQFVMDILAGLVSGWASVVEIKQLVSSAMAVLNSPKGANAGSLYGKRSGSSKGANFQILTCDSVKGQVTTAFIGSHISGTKDSHDYFFVTYESASLKVYYNSQVMTLDEDVYSQVRSAVVKKLGNNAKIYVENLKI